RASTSFCVGEGRRVAAAGCSASGEPVFQPFRRRLDFCATDDAGGEAAAEFGGLDFDLYGVGCFCCALGWFRHERLEREFIDGAKFARDPVVTQAIGTVRTDFRVN